MELTQGLPKEMMIGVKRATSPSGRVLTNYISPSSGSASYSPSSTVQFDIELRRGQYLNPKMLALKFNLLLWSTTNIATNFATACSVDNYASCFIQGFQSYVNSIQVESVQRWNDLVATYLDLQLSKSQKSGFGAVFGCNDADTAASNRLGMTLPLTASSNTSEATAAVYSFVIPIPSAFGCFSDTYIDGSDINHIRMDFQLAELGELPVLLGSGETVNWKLSQVELMTNIVELNNPMLVDQYKQGASYYFLKTAKTSSYFLPSATAGSVSIPLNQRGLSSVNTVFSRFRYAASAGNVASGAKIYRSASTCPNAAQLQYNFAGQTYPQRAVQCMTSTENNIAHVTARTIMAFNLWNSPLAGVSLGGNMKVNTVAGALDSTISAAASTLASTGIGGFAYGESLEMFPETDAILSGVSTKDSSPFLRLEIASGSTTGGTNSLNIACDNFLIHDIILVCDKGAVQLIN